MKTPLFQSSGFARLGACVAATLALSMSSALAAPSVKLPLGGEDFGVGNTIDVSSKTLLSPSKSYTYHIIGTCVGTGGLAGVVKSGTSISTIFTGIKLSGKYTNPDPEGDLPITVFGKNGKDFTGTRTIKGFGQVTISAHLDAGTDENGKVYFKVTNFTVTSSSPVPAGTIRLESGSKITIDAAPVVQFKTNSKNVAEAAGHIDVEIRKLGKGPASVQYATSNLTANSEDYVAVSGTAVFGPTEKSKIIPITILQNTVKKVYPTFKITLSNPGSGAALGAIKEETIGILNDD